MKTTYFSFALYLFLVVMLVNGCRGNDQELTVSKNVNAENSASKISIRILVTLLLIKTVIMSSQ